MTEPLKVTFAVTNVLIAMQPDGVPSGLHPCDQIRVGRGSSRDREERRARIQGREQRQQTGRPHGIWTVVKGQRDAWHVGGLPGARLVKRTTGLRERSGG